MRVAAVVRIDRAPEPLLDRLGQRKVHLRHPGRKDIGWVCCPLRAGPSAELREREVVERGHSMYLRRSSSSTMVLSRSRTSVAFTVTASLPRSGRSYSTSSSSVDITVW